MTMGDAPRMFFSCYFFFSSSVIFYLAQNHEEIRFSLSIKANLLFIQKINKKRIQFLNILFLIRLKKGKTY